MVKMSNSLCFVCQKSSDAVSMAMEVEMINKHFVSCFYITSNTVSKFHQNLSQL